jgi:hypothetical protein
VFINNKTVNFKTLQVLIQVADAVPSKRYLIFRMKLSLAGGRKTIG